MTNENVIHFEDCYLEDAGAPKGDGRINVCRYGAPIFSVAEGKYPKGTLFDVVITFTAKEKATVK